MHIAASSKVKDKDGVWGTVVSGSPHLFSNAAQVVVQTESGQQILVPTDMLVQQPDKSYYLPLRLAELEHYGSEHSVHQDEPIVVPVLREELEVQKRPVETGKVRIIKVAAVRGTWGQVDAHQVGVPLGPVPNLRLTRGQVAHVGYQRPLPIVGRTVRDPGPEFRLAQNRQEHRRENGDDRDDHQQFNQGEATGFLFRHGNHGLNLSGLEIRPGCGGRPPQLADPPHLAVWEVTSG